MLAQSQQSSNQSYEGSEKKVLDFLDVLLQAKVCCQHLRMTQNRESNSNLRGWRFDSMTSWASYVNCACLSTTGWKKLLGFV